MRVGSRGFLQGVLQPFQKKPPLRRKSEQKVNHVFHETKENQPSERNEKHIASLGPHVFGHISSFLPPEDRFATKLCNKESLHAVQTRFAKKMRPGFFKELVIKKGWDIRKFSKAERDALDRIGETVRVLDLTGLELTEERIDLLEVLFPNLEEVDLTEVEFANQEAIDALGEWKSIKKLILSSTALGELPGFHKDCALEYLDISNCRQLDPSNMPLIQSLKGINFSKTKLSHFNFLKNNPQIEELDLQGCQELTSGELQQFPRMDRLHTLSLQDTQIPTLQFLQNLPSMRKLNLSGCRNLTASELRDFPQLSCLEDLDLSCTHLDSLDFLHGLSQIVKLSLAHCEGLSLHDFDRFPVMTHLRSLNLASTQIQSFRLFENNQDIEEVNLSQCQNLPPFYLPFYKVRKLFVSGTSFAGLHQLYRGRENTLDRIEELDVSQCPRVWDYYFLQRLTNLKSLKSERIPGNQLSEGRWSFLEKLDLSGNRNVYEYYADFSHSMPNLKELNVSNSEIRSLDVLSRNPKLEVLHISHNEPWGTFNLRLLETHFPHLKKLVMEGLRNGELPDLSKVKKLEEIALTLPNRMQHLWKKRGIEKIERLKKLHLNGRKSCSRGKIEKVCSKMKWHFIKFRFGQVACIIGFLALFVLTMVYPLFYIPFVGSFKLMMVYDAYMTRRMQTIPQILEN